MANDDNAQVGTLRDVQVDWEALEDAFENNAPEVHSYLQTRTGEVLRVVDGIADPEMHARIAADATYMRVEPVSSREQYRWMERFIQMVEDRELRTSLTRAIDGKGAFRRFKDALMSQSAARERWFVFRSERLRVFMEAWLGAHALRPVPRVEPATLAEEAEASAEATPTSEVQDDPGAEGLRQQLRDVSDTLPSRDLEKVLAFAEFLKTRKPSRSTSRREEASEPQVPEGGSSSSHKITTH